MIGWFSAAVIGASRSSSMSFDDAEIALLKKGLNFAVTPAYIPATEIIAKAESATRQLDAEQAGTVRRAVNNILELLFRSALDDKRDSHARLQVHPIVNES